MRHPARQRRLLASLAESGQQTPIVVVAVEGQVDRYVVNRRLQTNLGAGAVGSGHGGSGGVADERGCGGAVGPLPATVRTRDGAGGGLALGGVGAAFWLWVGRVGEAVRSQCELGVATAGADRGSAGSDPTTGARWQDLGAGGDEVSGAGGPPKPGRLPTDGRHLRRASLRYAGSRPTVWRVAPRFARRPQTYSGRPRAVFQNAAASAGESSARDRG